MSTRLSTNLNRRWLNPPPFFCGKIPLDLSFWLNHNIYVIQLTPKQKRFVQEYLIDLNATQAAIRAGDSEHSARAIGLENLTKPCVEEALQAALEERASRTEVTIDWVVKQLVIVNQYCTNPDTFDSAGACRSAELLGKHLGMFVDRSEQVHRFELELYEEHDLERLEELATRSLPRPT